MCGIGRTVFVVSSNVGIHHWLDRLFLGFAVLVEVIVIHIEGTVTFKAEAEPLGEHHSLGVFELVISIPQTGIKLTFYIQRVSVGSGIGVCFLGTFRFVILRILLIEVNTVFIE